MKTPHRLALVIAASCLLLLGLSGCAPPPGGAGGGAAGGGAAGINPAACGTINTSKAGRKLYAFLVASAELDRASIELEQTVLGACRKMADALGVSSAGPMKEVCNRAATELEANLKVSVKSEQRMVTRYTPPVCHTSIDLTASFAAECEARATADVNVSCSGRCDGTCSGACDGQCAAAAGGDASGGQCAGQCQGTCRGRCTGRCDGYVDVDASAECKASAEVRAGLHTECSEPKVEVVRENVTVIDDSKFQKAMAAIQVGMPQILRAGARLERAGRAVGNWVTTGTQLVRATGQLVAELGEKGACVAGQVAGVMAAAANIQARFSVSIEVSAQVSASAGASAH
ncbi:MAG TPA: hypothetical protein VNO30_06225 [Kofleriaceae bacterium]|nr:hypothetical protein [Kofleriaceae bacterium]